MPFGRSAVVAPMIVNAPMMPVMEYLMAYRGSRDETRCAAGNRADRTADDRAGPRTHQPVAQALLGDGNGRTQRKAQGDRAASDQHSLHVILLV
jgi:hypothetical protein